nr:protein JASON-like [Tanacetum cinerariifolium]
MGCFFGCFRVQDDRHSPRLSHPIYSTAKDPVARNRLSSLLLIEAEGRDDTERKDVKRGVVGSAATDIDLNQLKAEAKYLKDCGTIPQTPAEIRNNEKLKGSDVHNGETQSLKFNSWLQTVSVEKLNVEKETHQLPSPIKLFDEFENRSDSSPRSPQSCVTGQNSERLFSSTSYVEILDVDTDQKQNPTASRNKSVRFEGEIDASSYSLNSSSSEVTCEEPKTFGLPSDYSVSKPSPYPTPISLTDDMQTPGTVFPSYVRDKDIRNNPLLKPVENVDQFKEMMKENFGSNDKQLNVDTSLSSWLPPKQAHQGRANRPFTGKTPGDRPIIGMVAAHWNADVPVASPPKWWDGNGIPNSTNKYKEDQKVSWHATPFEERLEKALSEDKLIAERKQLSKTALPPIALDENEGRVSHFEFGSILINSV